MGKVDGDFASLRCHVGLSGWSSEVPVGHKSLLGSVKLSKGNEGSMVLCIGGCRPYTAEKSMSGLARSGLPGRLLARASHRLHMDVYL